MYRFIHPGECGKDCDAICIGTQSAHKVHNKTDDGGMGMKIKMVDTKEEPKNKQRNRKRRRQCAECRAIADGVTIADFRRG